MIKFVWNCNSSKMQFYLQEGERNRGHRLDTKDRNSTFQNLRFSLSQKERELVTNVVCCGVDNGKGKENVHYAQDIIILYSTKFGLFQLKKKKKERKILMNA